MTPPAAEARHSRPARAGRPTRWRGIDTAARPAGRSRRPQRRTDTGPRRRRPSVLAALRVGEPVDDDVALVVTTSGTTGAPKGALLTGAALQASAAATENRLGGPGRWLLALPPLHIAGIQVVVRSLLAGTTPVQIDVATGFDVERLPPRSPNSGPGGVTPRWWPPNSPRRWRLPPRRPRWQNSTRCCWAAARRRNRFWTPRRPRGAGGAHLRHERDRRRLCL